MLANFNNTNGNTTKNPTVVIGIDHGYGNIKTANTCFRAGVTVYDKEPFFIIGSLQYNIQKQNVVLLRLLSCAASTLQNRDIHGFSLDLRGKPILWDEAFAVFKLMVRREAALFTSPLFGSEPPRPS